MQMKEIRGCNVSSLSLGTVQLGLNYGLNKTEGKPDRATSFSILDTAVNNGVNWLDTAAAYGDSEQVIGDWIQTLAPENIPLVATKVNALDHSSLDALRTSLREQIMLSKKRLGLEQIPLLMIHHCEEYFEDPDNMRQVFEEMKAEGHIRYSGISAYAFHDYKEIASSGFDAVQIPVNLFDWRQIENGGIQALEDANMIVFARSVFLQGLIFRQPDQLDERMRFCAPTLEKFHTLCQKYNMEPAVLAASFALSVPGISSLVIGCRNQAQIEATLNQMEQTVQLTDAQMEEIRSMFRDTDERVITPMLW